MMYGNRISWTYTHQSGYGSRGKARRFDRTKQGIFQTRVQHTAKHWRKPGARQMVYVLFDGNKNWSLVPLEDLRRVYE